MKRTLPALILLGLIPLATFANSRPDDHAPIGVQADHAHDRGEWMFSYRFTSLEMQGNLISTNSVTPEQIVTSVPNVFANIPGQPPTLRVVPFEMTTNMHMLGAVYGLTEKVTLSAMLPVIEKETEHITFSGNVGTDRLGEFSTRASDIGDARFLALVELWDSGFHSLHGTIGFAAPTGSNRRADRVLTPAGERPRQRLPYPMQLGSGTLDPIVGLNYSGHADRVGWGGQLQTLLHVGDNDDDYSLGGEQQLSLWGSLLLHRSLSVSTRVRYIHQGNVHGRDPLIVGPIQTANNKLQDYRRLEAGLGLNFIFPSEKHRLALEFVTPVDQDLAGPQLEADWEATFGVQWTR